MAKVRIYRIRTRKVYEENTPRKVLKKRLFRGFPGAKFVLFGSLWTASKKSGNICSFLNGTGWGSGSLFSSF